MYKKSLVAVTALCLSFSHATELPKVQLGLGVGLQHSSLTAANYGLNAQLGTSGALPQIAVSAAAIRDVSTFLSLSLDSKLTFNPLLDSQYLGIRSHFNFGKGSSLGIGAGITRAALPSINESTTTAAMGIPFKVDSNFVLPTYTINISTMLSQNFYTALEVVQSDTVRLSDNLHISSLVQPASDANSYAELVGVSTGNISVIIGYAV